MRTAISLIFSLFFFASVTAHAQQYTRKEVKESADSVLQNYVGDVLFEHCTYLNKGYYSYTDNTGAEHWAMLKKHKVTQGNLKNVHMSYKLDYDYPKCTPYSKITGIIYLTLNNQLQGIGKPDMSFVPDFVWKRASCNLMTEDEALTYALKEGFKESKKAAKMRIDYDTRLKQFTWTITNRIQKDSTLQKRSVVQTMRINAGTRKIVEYTKGPAAPKPQH